MKLIALFIISMATLPVFASNICDLDIAKKHGVVLVEFKEKNKVLSKMAFKDGTPDALIEEIYNLQDMNLCSDQIIQRKCNLEINAKNGNLTFVRGQSRWISWPKKAVSHAQNYLKGMKKVGLCS